MHITHFPKMGGYESILYILDLGGHYKCLEQKQRRPA